MTETTVKESLIETDDQFRRLHDEHQDYERRLSSIRKKASLSQEDEVEMKRIKLHKLSLKDQMAMILREHSPTATAS